MKTKRAVFLGVSHSYLSQVKNDKRPASNKVVSKMVSSGKQESIVLNTCRCYNLSVLGNSLAVGQRTLDP